MIVGRITGLPSACATQKIFRLRGGITISHKTIRDWVARFGIQFAAKVWQDQPRPADKWHLDEVVVPIRGRKHWLRRAVDANGDVLDIPVRSRRNKAAAMRFFRKPFEAWGQPCVIITDKLRSLGAAKADLAPGIEHRQHKGRNNRAERSELLPNRWTDSGVI